MVKYCSVGGGQIQNLFQAMLYYMQLLHDLLLLFPTDIRIRRLRIQIRIISRHFFHRQRVSKVINNKLMFVVYYLTVINYPLFKCGYYIIYMYYTPIVLAY